MKIIAVDDERIALSGFELILNRAVPKADIAAFRQAKEALAYQLRRICARGDQPARQRLHHQAGNAGNCLKNRVLPGNALPIDFSFLLGYNTQTIASNKRHSNAVLHHRKRS